jgi:hypothetical protein
MIASEPARRITTGCPRGWLRPGEQPMNAGEGLSGIDAARAPRMIGGRQRSQ